MTLDGVTIAAQWPSKQWVIWTNANGVPYEQNLVFLYEYCNKLGVNVLSFNYRGVGQSTG